MLGPLLIDSRRSRRNSFRDSWPRMMTRDSTRCKRDSSIFHPRLEDHRILYTRRGEEGGRRRRKKEEGGSDRKNVAGKGRREGGRRRTTPRDMDFKRQWHAQSAGRRWRRWRRSIGRNVLRLRGSNSTRTASVGRRHFVCHQPDHYCFVLFCSNPFEKIQPLR